MKPGRWRADLIHNPLKEIADCMAGEAALCGRGRPRSKIENNCIVGAGAIVTENTDIPDGRLVLGLPAKAVRAPLQEKIDSYYRKILDHKKAFVLHIAHLLFPQLSLPSITADKSPFAMISIANCLLSFIQARMTV